MFLWAVVSNAKEFVVDYTSELMQNYLRSTPKTKEEIDLEQKARRKKKLAYFRRMKRQMGLISPDKKNASGSKIEPTSKIDNLENELLQLKMELSAFSKPKSESALTIPPPPPLPMLGNRTSSTVKSATTDSIPAPPSLPISSSSSSIPAPPSVSLLTQIKEKTATQKTNIPNPIYGSGPNFASPKPQQKQQEPAKMSVAEMIKSASASGIALKTTNVDRSPNGTPLKKKMGSQIDLQSELFAAIRSKFHAVNRDKVDTDSDSDFSPAKKQTSTKKVAKEAVNDDKENQSPVKSVQSLLKKFGGHKLQQAASPLQERRSVNV